MGKKIKCACCGNLTIEEKWDVCPICNWQKDEVQEEKPDYWGGANQMSLNKAKEAYKKGKKVK